MTRARKCLFSVHSLLTIIQQTAADRTASLTLRRKHILPLLIPSANALADGTISFKRCDGWQCGGGCVLFPTEGHDFYSLILKLMAPFLPKARRQYSKTVSSDSLFKYGMERHVALKRVLSKAVVIGLEEFSD